MRDYIRREGAHLLRNIRSAAPLLLLRRPRLDAFRFSADQVTWLVLLNALVACAGSYLLSLPDPRFNAFGLAGVAMGLAGALLIGFIIGKFMGDDGVVVRFAVLEYSVTPYAYLAWLAVRLGENRDFIPSDAMFALYVGFAAWGLAVSGAIILHLCDRRWRKALPNFGSYAVLMFLPVIYVNPGEFWYAGIEDEGTPVWQRINEEDLYYSQPELLEQVRAALAPHRPGVTDLYFVGFAGYASEDVFMKEVHVAQRLLHERFDALGRSVLLINNVQTKDGTPLATAHNLRRVLDHVGRAMDREEDVLLLYLTSHGSPEEGLAVDFWPLSLNALAARDLKQALDAAGIKWRILLISACYSGQFVDVLKDDFTLVMTASAADRQSFGCGTESDFTYFGKALFDEQLTRPQPFLTALENVRQSITERERRERLEHSLPQLFVGEAIREKLAELDR